jgi:hypothetical protein
VSDRDSRKNRFALAQVSRRASLLAYILPVRRARISILVDRRRDYSTGPCLLPCRGFHFASGGDSGRSVDNEEDDIGESAPARAAFSASPPDRCRDRFRLRDDGHGRRCVSRADHSDYELDRGASRCRGLCSLQPTELRRCSSRRLCDAEQAAGAAALVAGRGRCWRRRGNDGWWSLSARPRALLLARGRAGDLIPETDPFLTGRSTHRNWRVIGYSFGRDGPA